MDAKTSKIFLVRGDRNVSATELARRIAEQSVSGKPSDVVDKAAQRLASLCGQADVRLGDLMTMKETAQSVTLTTTERRADVFLTQLARAGIGPKDVIDPTDLAYLEEVTRETGMFRVLTSGSLSPLLDGEAGRKQLETEIKARIKELESRKTQAGFQAKDEVEAYDFAAWKSSWFKKDEKRPLIDARQEELFDRGCRRSLAGAKFQRKVLEQLGEAMQKQHTATGPERAALECQIDLLRRDYIELEISAALNDRLGLIPQVGAQIRCGIRTKLSGKNPNGPPLLGKIYPMFDRSRVGQFGPHAINLEGEKGKIPDPYAPEYQPYLSSLDPVDSTWWRRRDPEKVTPARLYRGPWSKKPPQGPAEDELLRLKEFRSTGADGMHPQVGVAFGRDGEGKLKMYQDKPIAIDAILSRLFYAMGFNTDPVNGYRSLRVEPRALLAAYATNQKGGLRLDDWHHVPGRFTRVGISPWKMEKVVKEVHTKKGQTLEGAEAVKALKAAAKDPLKLAELKWVRVEHCDIELPGDGKAVGPWDYDLLAHGDAREVRALGMIFETWLGGNDIKFNNTRLDVVEEDDGKLELRHMLSDVGSPYTLPWSPDVSTLQKYVRSGVNKYAIDAFDRATFADAQWAVRLLGSLTEAQIEACVAAGSYSKQAFRYYTEKLIIRRDALVEEFKLVDELGLMRPDGKPQLDRDDSVLRFSARVEGAKEAEGRKAPEDVTVELADDLWEYVWMHLEPGYRELLPMDEERKALEVRLRNGRAT